MNLVLRSRLMPRFQPSVAWAAGVAFPVLALLVACGPASDGNGAPTADDRRQEERAAAVTIYRDDFGVPHIYGKTDADAVFGLLYAQAEDDFPRIERNYVWATGRLAEVLGEEAVWSDLRARLYMTEEEAKALYAEAPEELKELCVAFADGLNYYLRTHPEVEPQLLDRFEPWMPLFFFEGSIGGDIEQIPLDGIEAFYAPLEGGTEPALEVARTLSPRPDATERERLAFAREPAGSNGFAIAGSKTATGDAMLLINPHTSFYFRGEVHVVSEEGLNAYGAVTWGQFFVYQGFNEHNGWMHTSTFVDFIDEFVEDVRTGDGGELVYSYGDEQRPVEVGEATLRVKTDGGIEERVYPTYRTHHGPITHLTDGRWTTTRINWDPVTALRQSYRRTKTTNHAEFRAMMDMRTNSSNNTVYADADGTIGYYHGNFVPRRDPRFDYSQPVDGSDPSTDWQGLHTVDETITVLNPPNGWIQNANSTPFTAALEHSPRREDYPTYMAPDLENYRGVHAVRVLTDAADLTLESLIDLAYSPYVPAFEAVIPGLVAAYDAEAGSWQALRKPIEALRRWNFDVSVDSVPMTLAHFYGLHLNREAESPEGLRGIERFDSFGTQLPPAERLRLFAETVEQLERRFGSWSTPWGEVNRLQRLDGAIDQRFDDDQPSLPVGLASGRWGALASFGASPTRGEDGSRLTNRIYGRRGNSFVAVVEFGDEVLAKTLLAGGQSGDPESPHFFDQGQRYADVDFKDVAYYREDVEARAVDTYSPGQR
ncbi:MAG: penicillin acylase family protein [Acidobacteriota bacterium]